MAHWGMWWLTAWLCGGSLGDMMAHWDMWWRANMSYRLFNSGSKFMFSNDDRKADLLIFGKYIFSKKYLILDSKKVFY